MSQTKLLLILALLAGLGLGAWARDAIQSPPEAVTVGAARVDTSVKARAAPSDDVAVVIQELRDEIARANEERQSLRDQVDALSVRLSALDQQPAAAREEPVPGRLTDEPAGRRRGAGALTVAALTEAGISERDAGAIKSRLDDIAMQRLYLRDQAQREGWLGKEEYRNQIRDLNAAQNNLANEFGEDNYARYLYAMGRPNQVDVQSVIENSPAYNAGMQTGDRILSYDNQTVFDVRAVRRGTQRGTSGEMVPLVVMRNDQRVELYVPRGPLGITMNSQSVRPPDGP